MSRFAQLHVLTSYPPANLNRDESGRPKTALMGDALRLRVSSQSLKRAWRTSGEFESHLPNADAVIGDRTKRIGLEWVFKRLKERGVKEDVARSWTKDIQRTYGEPESSDSEPDAELLNGQLVHVSPVEREKLTAFVDLLAAYLLKGKSDELVESIEKAIQERDKAKDKKKANAALVKKLSEALLVKGSTAVDIALFGRMLAAVPTFNFDASVQVAHAITVHKAAVEDDYFSAVDDLNREDKGAGHIGERGYGAGLFYLYLCIDRELLKENLGGDVDLTKNALKALVHALTKVSPTGMQNSHASRAYASFVLGEKGDQQPRSLAQSFLKPIKPRDDEDDMLDQAVKAIERRRENFDKVYGACADKRYRMNVETGEGSLDELVAFVQE
ncbi:MAG: type I-E CRISPR-associated protein Cas7/Cse4/CasC [Betaproteobacteria bacterium]|nr:type I-E CRISPR-associated protein Cas7/Cse4/CasC [Betaproteobacteria bacterium]